MISVSCPCQEGGMEVWVGCGLFRDVEMGSDFKGILQMLSLFFCQ